jgi:dTDP-4-dehydrorhamnose 3,5-epimerase-like enzyme
MPLPQNFELLNFDCRSVEGLGSLVIIEGPRLIPFEVKRVYFVVNTPFNVVRGLHAHKTLHQVIFCPSGSCDFTLDDGLNKTVIRLNDPVKGLYMKPGLWREFTNFSPDCVVMVMASAVYDEADYIRDYEQFLRYARLGGRG